MKRYTNLFENVLEKYIDKDKAKDMLNRIEKEVGKENSIIPVIAIVKEVPKLEAAIIHFSNSPLFPKLKKIDDLHTAISTIGIDAVKNFIKTKTIGGE